MSGEALSLDIPEQISVYTSSDRRGKSILIWGKINRGNTYSRFCRFPKNRLNFDYGNTFDYNLQNSLNVLENGDVILPKYLIE